MSYFLEHATLGFCWWDLPAAIVLVAVIVLFVWKRHDLKKEKRDLEDQIAGNYANDAVPVDGK